MADNTVQYTAENNLCCGCGVCKGICPKGCVSWERNGGLYLPHIDEAKCVNCGLCVSVCPGLGHAYAPKETASETITGSFLDCFNAWSKHADLRHVSASGGVISTMVQHLLSSGTYDGAFCLDSYDYRNQLKTRLYTAEEIAACWAASNAPKSRYLPVSHENAVRYMKENRDKTLIFVGTSCAIRALQAAVQKLNLNRAQYLFIGLFCDKVFNYNVLAYFADTYADGATLKALHFKNKESGGWPGDMKFFPESGDAFYVPLAERAKAKAYFMPERCLYCVDKLNVCADISLGDNYTGKDDSPLGSNSVIVRTEAGRKAWSFVQDLLEIRPIEITEIQKAQFISGRLNHLYFGELKASHLKNKLDLNVGIPRECRSREYMRAWHEILRRIKCGSVYLTTPQKLIRKIKADGKSNNALGNFLKRGFYYIMRKVAR